MIKYKLITNNILKMPPVFKIYLFNYNMNDMISFSTNRIMISTETDSVTRF